MHHRGRVPGVALALAAGLLLTSCEAGEDNVWQRFNAPDEVLEVEAGVPDPGPPVEIDLHSNTGQHIIGRATVDPGSGPFGTEHLLVVQVGNDFDPDLEAEDQPIVERVGRVTVEVDSGARGVQQWELQQDTATARTWVLTLESMGAEGDAPRTDTFLIELWESVPEDEADPEAVDEEAEEEEE